MPSWRGQSPVWPRSKTWGFLKVLVATPGTGPKLFSLPTWSEGRGGGLGKGRRDFKLAQFCPGRSGAGLTWPALARRTKLSLFWPPAGLNNKGAGSLKSWSWAFGRSGWWMAEKESATSLVSKSCAVRCFAINALWVSSQFCFDRRRPARPPAQGGPRARQVVRITCTQRV
jgi:hypothetical protein